MALTVFLVDDNATFLAAVRGFLVEISDLEVIGSAQTGSDALCQTASLRPDVVLLDIELPDINGLDVGRILCGRTPQPQVIFLSMDDSEQRRAMAYAMGALALFNKAEFVRELVPLLEDLSRASAAAGAAK
jgi:DNA-binding NarL/FixJ family response regulator